MGEVAKPDYLSLVNQGGSGFNVSELVTAIVASEIEPKRAIQTSKQETTENAISGIGFLNSQVAVTQKNFNTIAGDTFFTMSSTNSSGVEITATDESKLEPGNRTIENVTLAKNDFSSSKMNLRLVTCAPLFFHEFPRFRKLGTENT